MDGQAVETQIEKRTGKEEGSPGARESLRQIIVKGLTRVLHPIRRRSAKARVGRLAEVRRIVVLCNGNICRSPYGEARLQDLVQETGSVEVVSRGLIRPGRPAPPEAQAVAEERDLSLADHRSALMTREDARDSDLALVMSKFQARTTEQRFGVPRDRILVLGDLDPGRPDSRTILDPLGHSKAFFREVYDRMDRCLEELASSLGGPS